MGGRIRRPDCDPAAVADAVRLLRAGQPVAFPTETVYGLGAPALDHRAVARIFSLKGRPADNPLIVHLSSAAMLDTLVAGLPEAAEALIKRFWPGPLALVLPRAAGVPDIVTAGLDTVAVRMPDHPVALALLDALGEPLAAPSANRSGRPSPTRAGHVAAEFEPADLPLILDGGPCVHGLESTVLDLSGSSPRLLRPGAVTTEQLEPVVGPLAGKPGEAAARSPGLRHRHYMPDCRVVLAEPSALSVVCARELAAGHRVGLFCVSGGERPSGLALYRRVPDLATFGRAVFATLHEAGQLRLDVLVVERVSPEGLGLAIMDRLRRAAGAEA
ncbi:MAG: threonylcarbamoyl-AMP synthase [Chromatiales bacterium]|nr:threonylcarbamoyl-AMP synthase [Chromatiales bacterium]